MRASVLQLPFSADVDLLKSDLELADRRPWPPVIGPHQRVQWTGIALRSKDGRPASLGVGTKYYDTELMSELHYMRGFLDVVRSPLRRVRLLSLHPHQAIGWHVDPSPPGDETHVRLHLPILSSPKSLIEFEHGSYHLSVGHLWFIDVSQRHRALNMDESRRVHLVIDCVMDDWLGGLLDDLV